MSKARLAWFLVTGLTCLAATGAAQTVTGAVIAVVDGQPISQTDLNERVGDKLLRLKTDEYNIVLSTLNRYIDDLLLAHDAASRHMSVEELRRADGSDLIRNLRAQKTIQIALEPPRLAQPISGGHTSGPADAQVSIVEFSDFQCPYCGKLTGALDKVRKKYGNQVRLTFKQFPLPSHPQAAKAAEASLCAADQGKFWEMHDQLFAEQRLLAMESFSELAGGAGVDIEAFEACRSTHRTSAELSKDRADGTSLGINATPTFFINGRMYLGAKSSEALDQLIESELHRLEPPVRRKDTADANQP